MRPHGKKMLLCGGLLLGSTFMSIGQALNPPSTDPKLTPNVGGNEQSIGNIFEPNLFDGSVNISIPIFQYDSEAGELGVSLGYNTKGVKVDEQASSAGLHFNLNAGGQITRVMKDFPDEFYRPIKPGYGEEYPAKGKWITTAWPPGSFRYEDGEHDDFILSIGRLNFTFNRGKDGFLFTHPHHNIQVDFTVNGNVVDFPSTTGFSGVFGFKVTDEKGCQYWFKPGIQAKKAIYNGKQPAPELLYNCTYTASWVIDRVVLPNGQQVQYYYTIINNSSIPLYKAFSCSESAGGAPGPISGQLLTEFDQATSQPRLDSILYPNHKQVNFTYTASGAVPLQNQAAILKSITTKQGPNCLRYRFHQRWLISAVEGASLPPTAPLSSTRTSLGYPSGQPLEKLQLALRVRLDSIRMESCSSSETELYYAFRYNGTPLPPRLSGAQDYFGYYANSGKPDPSFLL